MGVNKYFIKFFSMLKFQFKNIRGFTTICIIVIIVLFTFILFFTVNNYLKGDLNPNKVNFIISSEYNEYLEGELIWLKLKIINRSGNDFYLHSELSLGGGSSFDIKDDEGNILRSMLVSEPLPGGDSLLLSSGDSVESNENLSWYPSVTLKSSKEYKIVAHYEDLTSNEITIPIKKPDGIEKEMFDFMKKDYLIRENIQISRRVIDSLAIDMVNKYPDSRFTPQIYDRLLRSLTIYGDSSTCIKNFDNYMIKNSNRSITEFMITSYKAHLKSYLDNNTEISQKLEELKSKYGYNENLNKMIDRYIKQNINHEKFWFK